MVTAVPHPCPNVWDCPCLSQLNVPTLLLEVVPALTLLLTVLIPPPLLMLVVVLLKCMVLYSHRT